MCYVEELFILMVTKAGMYAAVGTIQVFIIVTMTAKVRCAYHHRVMSLVQSLF